MSTSQEPTRDVFESGRRGISHTGVRRANEKTVLTVVAFNAGASNAEISRLSGLAPQTVSAILVDLERDGLIVRGPVLRGRRGQPATPILLNADGGFAIGVEIGWRHLDVILLNLHAQVIQHHHETYDCPDATSIFDRIADVVATFSAGLSAPQRARLLDLGIAMPGSLKRDLDLLGAPSGQVQLWRETDPAQALHERTGLEVALINDGNAGCWAELIALAPPRPANVIYLMVSQLLLAGIISDGTLWEGPTGHAADLGSMFVSGEPGGRKLAHQVASLFGLRAHLAAAGHDIAAAPIEDWNLATMAPDIDAWIDDSAKALAQVIHNATMIVEQPLVIVEAAIGGDTSARLARQLHVEMAALSTRGFKPPRLVGGQLGSIGPAVGAAELPLFRRYF